MKQQNELARPGRQAAPQTLGLCDPGDLEKERNKTLNMSCRSPCDKTVQFQPCRLPTAPVHLEESSTAICCRSPSGRGENQPVPSLLDPA
ncbi:hypothetical protein DPEC_G00283810 [Dallia pectoralis]|uniref:Uncharacterized protein n=1 Tax=Dallia pectoralis TaxID=75939 RepID=A0ACC2FJ79_DALPE|nr:hypothetical protein DPEC_G00283810 [Dallia pectoralis]